MDFGALSFSTIMYPVFSHQELGLAASSLTSNLKFKSFVAVMSSFNLGDSIEVDFGILLPCFIVLFESRFTGQIIDLPFNFKKIAPDY